MRLFLLIVSFQQLLPDLMYAETVTVHCVYNGPAVNLNDADFEFDTEAYCNRLASLNHQ